MSQHFNCIWDIFYDGVPFLFRVAMALITCCRRQILDAKSEESLLKMLHHPPLAWLSPTPEGPLSLVFTVKLKDADVRNQRVNMEAQVKRRTEVPRTTISRPTKKVTSAGVEGTEHGCVFFDESGAHFEVDMSKAGEDIQGQMKSAIWVEYVAGTLIV